MVRQVVDVVLGISIGPSSARFRLVVRESGMILEESTIGITASSYDMGLNEVIVEVNRIRNLSDDYHLVAIGTCVTGELTADGQVLRSRALSAWKFHNPLLDLKKAFRVPVLAVGSGSAAARGELSHPHREGSFIYVLWGSGFSVADVTQLPNGQYIVRPTGFGHMIIPSVVALRCSCGRKGHLESQVAGANLRIRFNNRRVDRLTQENWEVLLNDLAAGLYNIGLSKPRIPIVIADRHGLQAETERLLVLRDKVRALSPSGELAPVLFPAYELDPKIVGAVYLAKEAAV